MSLCKLFLLLLLASLTLAPAVWPQEQGQAVSTLKDRVSLRRGPGVETDILRILPQGEVLELLGRQPAAPGEKAWLDVRTSDGWRGFVREDMLSPPSTAPAAPPAPRAHQESAEPFAAPIEAEPLTPAPPLEHESQAGEPVDPPPTATEQGDAREAPLAEETRYEPLPAPDPESADPALSETAQTWDQAAEAVLARDRVRLRSRPGTDSEVLSLLAQGQVVAVLEREPGPAGKSWILIETRDGRSGFVREDMLTFEQARPLRSPISPSAPFADPAKAQTGIAQVAVKAAGGDVSVLHPGVSLLRAPEPGAVPAARLAPNQSLELLGRVSAQSGNQEGEAPGWLLVRTVAGQKGYVRAEQVSSLRLVLLHREHELVLYQGKRELGRHAFRLCAPAAAASQKDEQAHAAADDAAQQTSTALETGILLRPPRGRYMLRKRDDGFALFWPTAAAARLALQEGRMVYEGYVAVIRSLHAGKMPVLTPLGPGMRITAAGFDGACPEDCQAEDSGGCLLLEQEGLEELMETLPDGARLDVYPSSSLKAALAMPQYRASRLVGAMYRQLEQPAFYTADAGTIIPMSYPMGDIPAHKGLDADVVVRTLRAVDLDLQALLHEDVLLHPGAYEWINTPNPMIDHRRPRNLALWLQRNAESLSLDLEMELESFQPGDVLVFDTGLPNGTPYDLVGLVSMERSHGLPTVFTIYEPGGHARTLPLLDGPEPALVGHFRLAHPYEYK